MKQCRICGFRTENIITIKNDYHYCNSCYGQVVKGTPVDTILMKYPHGTKTIDINSWTHKNLTGRKKAWKKKSLSDTIDYLMEIVGSFEEGGMDYETDEKGRAI